MSKITYIEESGDLEAEIMTGADLMDATTTVVRTIARDHKTDVVFMGDGAATNGRDVILPSIPSDAKITRRQALVTGGYANHESLHKLLTDFEGLSPRMKRWHSGGKKLTKHLANAIEDIRIEAGGQVLYNGLPKSIDKTAREVNRHFIDVVYKQDPKSVEDFKRIGPVAVTWEGRRRLGYPDPSMAEAMALLPEDVRKRVEKIVDQVMALPHGVIGMGRVDTEAAHAGSIEAAKLAERIANAYEREMKKKREQEAGEGEGEGKGKAKSEGGGKPGDSGAGKAQAQGKGDGDEAEGQGQGQGQGEAEGQGGEAGRGENTDDGGQSGGPSGGVGASMAQHGGSDDDVEPVSAELGDAMRSVMSNVLGATGSYRVFAPSEDKFEEVDTGNSERSLRYRRAYQVAKGAVGPQVGTVRRKLERVMMSQAQTFWEGGKRSGRLDVRRNSKKIVELRPDVFRRRQEESAVNTALSILVDMSGSMSSSKIFMAQRATIAICEALDGMRVPLEVLGHHTAASSAMQDAWYRLPQDRRKMVSRVQSIDMHLFKGFDEPLSMARAKLGRMTQMTDGANADGDAIVMAAKRLMARREPRKVMLVLSDGEPAYTGYNRNIHNHTRDCVKWVGENGRASCRERVFRAV